MKKFFIKSVAVLLIAATMFGSSSCIGSFQLTNRLLGWNKNVSNKFLNELVFFAFWILPVYEVSALADLLVLNSIEFWSGRNPMTAQADRIIEGENGQRYLVKTDADGYDITNLETDDSMRLEYDAEDMSWNVETDGQRHVLFTFVDDTHVALPDAEGTMHTIELSQAGLYAYQAIAAPSMLAAR